MQLTEEQKKEYLEYLKKEHSLDDAQANEYFDYVQKQSEPQVSNSQLDIPWKDRFAAKNYTGSPEAALGMLEKLHPEKEFILKDGEVYGKTKGAAGPYNPIDPSGFDWADITDVGTDMIKGASAGAGTAAGFAMGGPFGAYLGGGAAMSVAEQLKQALGAAAGIENNFNPTQSTIDLMTGGLPIERILKPIGSAVRSGAGVIGSGIRKAADYIPLKMAGFSKDEAAQYLNNGAKVKELVKYLGGDEGFFKAEDMAAESLDKLKNTLRDSGLNINKEMEELLYGKNVKVNLSRVGDLINSISDPEDKARAWAVLQEARITALSNSPMKAVTQNVTQSQPVLQGLRLNEEVAPTLSQKGKVVIDPKTKVARMEGGINYDFATGTFIRNTSEAVTPSRASKMKFLDGTPGRFGAYTEPKQKTYPQSDFWQAPEEQQLKEALQEALFKNGDSELSTITGNQARKLRQIMQEEASYGKDNPVTAKGSPKYTSFHRQATELNKNIREVVPESALLDREMQRGLQLQDLLEAKSSNPLSFLKSMDEGSRASLSRAVNKSGDKSVLDLMNQLGAAREILDLTDANKNSLIKRQIRKPLARGALKVNDFLSEIPGYKVNDFLSEIPGYKVNDFLSEIPGYIDSATPDSNIWNAIMSQEINKRMSNKNEK